MKKLLLLLLLIPNLVMAGECSVTQFVKEPMSGNPLWINEVKKRIEALGCKRKDILELSVFVPNQGKNTDGAGNSANYVSEGLIFGVAREKCNFKQTIMYDVEGGMYNLVCVLK